MSRFTVEASVDASTLQQSCIASEGYPVGPLEAIPLGRSAPPWPRCLAAGELEGDDACTPVERTGGGQILVRVPEGAVIDRVNADAAVVAPAVQGTGLRSAAPEDEVLRLHRPQSTRCH